MELALPVGATMAALGPGCKVPSGSSFDRIQSFLCEVLGNRLPELHALPAIGHPWPAELDPAAVPWRVRTRNRLANARLLDRVELMETITFGQLERVRQLGPVGILDFLATLESARHELYLARVKSHDAPEQSAAPNVEASDAILEALDQDWIDKVSRDDPRFAPLIPPIRGTLFETIDELTSGIQAGQEAAALMRTIAETIPQVEERAKRISALPIEDALRELTACLLGGNDERVSALMARMHWNGQPKAHTLEAAGALVGITRERIRQLEKRIRSALDRGRYYLPQLDRGMRLLSEQAPLTLEQAARALKDAGVSRTDFDPRSLIAVASDMHRTPLVQLDGLKGREAVVREPISPAADRVIEVAFRQLGQVGATNVSEVSSELQGYGVLVSDGEIAEILKLYGGARFIDHAWFWCPSRPHCNLVTQARKMLSVVSPLNVATLREGMKRVIRFRRISGRRKQALVVPTKGVLQEYLRGHPEFLVDAGAMVRYVRPLDHRTELPATEQIMFRVLAASPSGILERSDFQDACVSRGLNRNTWAVLTTYSPILQSLGGGLWTLRGRQVDPAAVEVLRQLSSERPREKRLVDYGWTPDGGLWIAVRLPDNPCGVLPHVPSPVRRYLTSQTYVALTEAGVECGGVKIYDTGVSTGYARFLQQAGADEGDILVAEFDLSVNSVQLRLLDDELLEEFASGPLQRNVET